MELPVSEDQIEVYNEALRNVSMIEELYGRYCDAVESVYRQQVGKIPLARKIRMLKDMVAYSDINENFLFITINPAPDVEFLKFAEKVHKLCRSPYIANARYTFEQRGRTEEEVGKGFHAHIICDCVKNYNPSKIHGNIFSMFKKMCGNKNHIDIKKYPRKYYEDKILYLKGQKWDSDKLEAVNLNHFWREKNSLEDIYNAAS